MTTSSTRAQIVVDFLKRRHPDLGPIAPDLDLIESRIISSMMFVELLYLLEEATGEEIKLENVTPDDFRTLNSIHARFLA